MIQIMTPQRVLLVPHRLTLHAKLELFGVRDGAGRHPLRSLLAHAVVVPPLLGLAPQVGAAVHAGNVEHGDALQGGVAEVQDDAVALRGKSGEETVREGLLTFGMKGSLVCFIESSIINARCTCTVYVR